MDFEDKIKNINDDSFVDRRINQLKYLIFENIGLPKDSMTITIEPRKHHSKNSDRFTDIWNIDIYIDVKTEVDPILSEIALLFNKIENGIDKVFKNIGVNQFMDFVKNPDINSYGHGAFVSLIELNGGMINLHINIDYETIPVEGAGDL